MYKIKINNDKTFEVTKLNDSQQDFDTYIFNYMKERYEYYKNNINDKRNNERFKDIKIYNFIKNSYLQNFNVKKENKKDLIKKYMYEIFLIKAAHKRMMKTHNLDYEILDKLDNVIFI